MAEKYNADSLATPGGEGYKRKEELENKISNLRKLEPEVTNPEKLKDILEEIDRLEAEVIKLYGHDEGLEKSFDTEYLVILNNETYQRMYDELSNSGKNKVKKIIDIIEKDDVTYAEIIKKEQELNEQEMRTYNHLNYRNCRINSDGTLEYGYTGRDID